MHKSILAGLAGGLAAIFLWAGIAWLSGFTLGFIAAFFGLAVGIAFRAADKHSASTARGLAAAAITILAIFIGKFAVARIAATQSVEDAMTDSDDGLASGDDPIIMEVADQIIERREEAGIESDWPETESDNPRDCYPADVWAQAESEFYNLTEAEQQTAREEYEINLAGQADGAASALTILYFLFSFRFLDLLWIGTSIGAAYKFGTVELEGQESAEAPPIAPHVSSGSPLRGLPPMAPPPSQQRTAA